MPGAAAPQALTPLEVAYGLPLGLDPCPPEETRLDLCRPEQNRRFATPRAALEAVLEGALSRPPCAVSFSGGRDSSALLATAIAVARRHGYDDPVPVTLVFPGDNAADEEEWQRLVLDHLAVRSWERVVITGDRLDAVGPVATRLMRRHGLLWPFNTHFHEPLVESVRGGSIITGFGGDELANSAASRRAARVLDRQTSPSISAALSLGFAFSPATLRRAVIRRRFDRSANQLAWLSVEGRRAVSAAFAADEAAEPWRWDRLLDTHFSRGRYFRFTRQAFQALGEDHGVAVHHPFVDRWLRDALARAFGASAPSSRAALMRYLFGDLLPDLTIERSTKASFSSPLWTETARSFARSWSGYLPDVGDLVDVDALRREWLHEGGPDIRSTVLLQAAWLQDNVGTY